MAKHLLKAIKLADDVKSGDWLIESNWMVIDSNELNQITIFNKAYVHPVYCKDCEYWGNKPMSDMLDEFSDHHQCKCYLIWTASNDFCSKGERKDEVNND